MAETGGHGERLKPWWYGPGQSGHPGGGKRSRAAIQARAIDLAADLGGWSNLSVADQQLLNKAAELSMRPTLRVDHETAVRIGNAIDRILRGLRKRHARPKIEADQSGRPKLGIVR